MTISKSLAWLALAPLLFACGEDAQCPAGTIKRDGVCVKVDPAGADDDGESIDGGTPDDGEDDGTAMHDAGCAPGSLVYVDMDGDGVGAGEAHEGCPSDGLVTASGDCSPENALVFPGADEVCNGIDDNCNEDVDEGVSMTLYADMDGDGHGAQSDPGVTVCAGQPIPGKVASNDDCDDDCAACSPDNAAETACDGKDENCDGTLDEGLPTTPYFLDCDGDGYLPEAPEEFGACSRPSSPEDCNSGKWLLAGEETEGRDCSDLSAIAYPGSTGAGSVPVPGTNGFDYDCDGDETRASATCPFAAAGGTCTVAQQLAEHECFTGFAPQCGAEAPALRCVASLAPNPPVWRAIDGKRMACQ
jgi:hypothetical protein